MIILTVTILTTVLMIVIITIRLLLGEKPHRIKKELSGLKIRQLPAYLKHSVERIFSRKHNADNQ